MRTTSDGETRGERWRRRLVSIPGYLLLTLLVTGLAPLLLAAALAGDVVLRRRLVFTRYVIAIGFYLLCESAGIILSGLAWLVRALLPGAIDTRFIDWNYALQGAWAGVLFGGARRLFGLRVEVDGDDVLAGGPIFLLVRHASTVDTVLPAVFVTNRHGIRLRYVIKRELLWDPCLDIVGNRLPNVFVRRGSQDSAAEIAAVSRLAEDMEAREGVLIYPEGTRFTEEKRARILERLAAAGHDERTARARALRNVLPPRLGGPLALLEARPDVDVVFLAHTGFEGTTSLQELSNGALIGRTIRIKFWRVRGQEIPGEREAKIDWLYAQWATLDDWIGRNRTT